MKVCCLNNYPLGKMSALADAGRVPRQHTWGIDALAARGHRVVLAPFHEPFEGHPLDRVSTVLRHELGQLDQELHALTRTGVHVVYCAEQQSARGLAVLPRRLRRAAVLVSLVHHPLSPGARNRSVLGGHDLLIALSDRLRDDLLRDHALPAERVIVAAWGPDLSSPLYQPTGAGPVVSAGKSNRDLPTLVAALAEVGAPAVVYDLAGQITDAPENVRVVRSGGPGADPVSRNGGYLMEAVMNDIRAANAVAIPISDPCRLTGLTELNDALALAKPIIMTRSPYTPIDIESVGCGLLVDPGDVRGWILALERVTSDPSFAAELGRRGRAYAEAHVNYGAFGDRLVDSVERVLDERGELRSEALGPEAARVLA